MITTLALIAATAAGHPIHETLADGAFDSAQASALELSIRFDPADLRDGLAHWSGLELDPADIANERFVGAYLEWHLRTLDGDTDTTRHDFIGVESDGPWLWAHVALELPTETDSVTIRNTICFDNSPTHTNRLTIRSEDFVQTLVFTHGQATAPLDLPRSTGDSHVTPH